MLYPETNQRFISILSDGKIHETVSKDTEGAILREYETSSGEKGEKWELVYARLEGKITNVQFQEGEYGENIHVTFQFEDGTEVVLSQSTAGSFGEDLMKRLPGVNFDDKVGLSPYAFENEKGKMIRGVGLYQTSDKVGNFFFEDGKALHGYPVPEGDTETYDKDDWKIHFIKVRKFLVAYVKEHIVPKFAKDSQEGTGIEYPENVNPKDVVF